MRPSFCLWALGGGWYELDQGAGWSALPTFRGGGLPSLPSQHLVQWTLPPAHGDQPRPWPLLLSSPPGLLFARSRPSCRPPAPFRHRLPWEASRLLPGALPGSPRPPANPMVGFRCLPLPFPLSLLLLNDRPTAPILSPRPSAQQRPST